MVVMDPEQVIQEAEELHEGQKELHHDQEQLHEAQAELLVEQKALNNRMIAHLEQFEHEKELVNQELVDLGKWKAQEEGKLRKVVKGLMLFVALWALGGVVSGYYIWDTVQTNQENITRNDAQTAEIGRLESQNTKLIKQVDALNRTQADASYKDCVSRNERAKVSIKEFGRLEVIAKRDGNMHEAKFWRGYKDKISKEKLPVCEKPKSGATGDGDPTDTPTNTPPPTTTPRS